MKIALVLDDTLDKPDGVQQYVLTLGDWLRRNGHQVFYLCAQTKRTDIPNVISLGSYLSTKFNGNSVRTPLPNLSRINHIIADIDPDIVHVQVPYSPFLAGRVISAARAKAAIVGTFHVLPTSRSKSGLNRGLGLVLRPTLRRFDEMIAVSEPAAEFAKSAYGLKANVIPNPVDLARFRHDRKVVPSSIVFLGRLVERKGVFDLIRAYNLLPDELANISRLVIGGAGPQLVAAKKLVANNRRVEFRGFIAESEKPAFLGSADLCVFPSTGGESFGIVLLEAMAAGTTVLAASNPGYKSVLSTIPDCMFSPRDPAGLSALLVKFLTDNKQKARVKAEQAALVRRFDINVVGPKIAAVYDEARLTKPPVASKWRKA